MIRRTFENFDTRAPILVLAGALLGGWLAASAAQPTPQQQAGAEPPVAVRNETPRPGREVLVLRHQQLKKNAHADYYRASREGVWPWFEKIGTRIVGQWLVVRPDGGTPPASDEAYRLARYASFEHWRATRDQSNATLGGNGSDREKGRESGRERGGVQLGSKGAYFLAGEYADTRPLYMPGVPERYERVAGAASPGDDVIAMRSAAARPGREIVELRYQRIEKNAFDRFVSQTVAAIWPWEEKLGARPIGQWRVIYPDAPSRTRESAAFDEVVTMTRYASYEHWQAMRPERAVLLGGNGPDWRAWKMAADALAALTQDQSVEFLEGEMYHSPPVFMPSLGERYTLAR
jgi:hypothetical protein